MRRAFLTLLAARSQAREEEAYSPTFLSTLLEAFGREIGGEAGDLIDPENMFCEAYGITDSGAVIIRPDGFIGWRSKGAHESVQEALQALTQTLSTLLSR